MAFSHHLSSTTTLGKCRLKYVWLATTLLTHRLPNLLGVLWVRSTDICSPTLPSSTEMLWPGLKQQKGLFHNLWHYTFEVSVFAVALNPKMLMGASFLFPPALISDPSSLAPPDACDFFLLGVYPQIFLLLQRSKTLMTTINKTGFQGRFNSQEPAIRASTCILEGTHFIPKYYIF